MGGGARDIVGSSKVEGPNKVVVQDAKPPAGGVEEPLWKQRTRGVVDWLIHKLGAPREELSDEWVRRLCMFNGALAFLHYTGEFRDRRLHKTPSGERKVASYSVMNLKYTGVFKVILFTHIASGTVAQLGSSLSIALENSRPELSRKLARVAATAETFFHAPTAFAMSPIVYGDKGITPLLYGLVSFLLQLSGAAALLEATDQEGETEGKTAPRPELRRMCTTISIFLYVRLYAAMRGAAGMLQKQKYSMAVMTAGAAMMPVGWQRFAFPAYFWVLMMYNGRTVRETVNLTHQFGVDGAAKRQKYLA